MREALADESAERRVVPGAAADHDGDLTLGDDGAADDAAGHAPDVASVRGDESVDHLVRERGGVVPQAGHRVLSLPAPRRPLRARPR